MADLFNNKKGFVLERVELYNFGNFRENEPQIIQTEGLSALFYGGCGTGKSTVADAFSLLFSTSLHTNRLNSTVEGSSRTLSDYMVGRYSQEENAYHRHNISSLRTIIMAIFRIGEDEFLTIGRVERFKTPDSIKDNNLTHLFFWGQRNGSITESCFKEPSELLCKKLTSAGYATTSKGERYLEEICNIMGVNPQIVPSLFTNLLRTKSVTDLSQILNAFVLNECDMTNSVEETLRYITNGLHWLIKYDIKRNIINDGITLEELASNIYELRDKVRNLGLTRQQIEKMLPLVFCSIYKEQHEAQKRCLEKEEQKKEVLAAEIEALNSKYDEIVGLLNSGDNAKLEQIHRDLESARRNLSSIEKTIKKYRPKYAAAGIVFPENREKWVQHIDIIDSEIQSAENNKKQKNTELEELSVLLKKDKEFLGILNKRIRKISKHHCVISDTMFEQKEYLINILNDTLQSENQNLSDSDVFFLAEAMEFNLEGNESLYPIINAVYSREGKTLIVNKRYQKNIEDYFTENAWSERIPGVRILYMDTDQVLLQSMNTPSFSEGSLLSKIQFNKNLHPEWVRYFVFQNWPNPLIVNTVDDFKKSHEAVIGVNGYKNHMEDYLFEQFSASDISTALDEFIFGYNINDKITELIEKQDQLQKEISALEVQQTAAQTEKELIECKIKNLQNVRAFAEITDFSAVDPEPFTKEIASLLLRQKEYDNGQIGETYRRLSEEKNRIYNERNNKVGDSRLINDEISRLRKSINDFAERIELLSTGNEGSIPEDEYKEIKSKVKEYLYDEYLTKVKEDKITKEFDSNIKKELDGSNAELYENLTSFVNIVLTWERNGATIETDSYSVFYAKEWYNQLVPISSVSHITNHKGSPSIKHYFVNNKDCISVYIDTIMGYVSDIKKKIGGNNKERANENNLMFDLPGTDSKVQQFIKDISRAEENIKKKFALLNVQLKNTGYTEKDSYIELNYKKKNNLNIQNTYSSLRTLQEKFAQGYDVLGAVEKINSGDKNTINATIEKLSSALDILQSLLSQGNRLHVAEWYTYEFVINYPNGKRKVLKDTSTASGGEAVICTYAVLLASVYIAYRLNDPNNEKGLRMIMIDETFQKVGEKEINAFFRMSEGLGLQSIVIHPKSENTFIMSDYIKVVYEFYKSPDVEFEVCTDKIQYDTHQLE